MKLARIGQIAPRNHCTIYSARSGIDETRASLFRFQARNCDRHEKDEMKTTRALGAGMCRWPEGDPRTDAFWFCGRPAVAGKPYCGEHCARAYVKSTRNRKVGTTPGYKHLPVYRGHS